MKRCSECGREYDNSMMFCLDDGAELLYGPASPPESFYWGIVTEQDKEEWIAKLQKQAAAGNFWLSS